VGKCHEGREAVLSCASQRDVLRPVKRKKDGKPSLSFALAKIVVSLGVTLLISYGLGGEACDLVETKTIAGPVVACSHLMTTDQGVEHRRR
jgi:hypothetical protein